MNKLVLSLALVAMVFVGLAAANGGKSGLRNKHHLDDDLEDDLLDHHHHGHHHGHRNNLHHRNPINRHGHGHKHLPVHRRGGKGAAGAVGVGAGAGIRGEHELDAGVHHNTRLGSHKSAEGQKAFLAGSKSKFGAGLNHHKSDENEGHHRTHVHNKNKLVVAEKDTGFDDDKGFHNRHDEDDSAHIGASADKFVGGKAGGRLTDDHEFENDQGANLHHRNELAAGIGAGAGAIGGGLSE